MLDVDGLRVVVLGVEDLLMDRLRAPCACARWKSDEDRRWATRLALLYAGELDWEYLLGRAANAEERAALEQLQEEAR